MNKRIGILILYLMLALGLQAQQQPNADTKAIFESNLSALDSAFGEHAVDTLASLSYIKNISIMATLTGLNPPPDDILCWDYIEWKKTDYFKYRKKIQAWYKKHQYEEPNHNVQKLISLYQQKANTK